jgi:CRP-like cAMP-binding protein
MASKKAYVDHLRSVPLFASCTRKELDLIAKSGDEITMTAGTMLVDQGQTGHEAFVVVDGKVAVKRNGRKVATLGPGDVFGELALLDNAPRNATVVADTDMQVLVLTRPEFNGLLDEVPGLARKVLTGVARRLRTADSKSVH